MKTLVSFSGGRTSAKMCEILLSKEKRENLIFVFANTGREHEKTLEFADKVDRHFGLNLVWVEAVIHMKENFGTTFRVVNFESATRDISLFKAMAFKYGLPGPGWGHCTRELKERPLHAYMKHLKIEKYKTAIGIRADEVDRMRHNERYDFIYPLIPAGITKPMVLDYWKKMPFDLEIPEHLGNCTACWKKSNRKLALVAKETPQFIREMMPLDSMGKYGAGNIERKMFRGRRTVADILALNLPDEDVIEDSCAESCEAFA